MNQTNDQLLSWAMRELPMLHARLVITHARIARARRLLACGRESLLTPG